MRLSFTQKLGLAPIVVALFFTLLCFGYVLPEVNRAIDAQVVLLGSAEAPLREQISVLFLRLSMVVLVALVVFGVGGFFVTRRLLAPLRDLTRAADRIANGDLTQSVYIHVESSDELGQLSRAFGMMGSQLKELLHQLQSSSEMLSTSVSSLNVSANEQNQMVNRQAVALQETQVTAQEIRQTAQSASTTAESVLAVAERAESIGKAGEATLNASISALEDLQAQVGQIAERIMSLGTRAQQISGITETVKDLADQSNMLAVNAAIEAARSGEHGKGFAVVAREIRALADQSIRSTKQVREILADIGSAIKATVDITTEGMRRMESGLVQARASSDSLRELSTIVRDNAASVRQIAYTVNQQSTGIEQIFTAVSDLNQLMEETVKRIGHTSSAALSLKSLSEDVSAVVGDYRV
jgi:methyl-accepting chemotaxis protein